MQTRGITEKRLSKRLQALSDLVTSHYDHIWDCCCDHGYLGMSLMYRNAGSMIHFVDTEAHLVSSLNDTLKEPEFSLAGGRVSAWRSHCLDAAKLPIRDFPGSHLIIISGVGGDLVAHIVTQLCEQYPNAGLSFLLCPIRQNYELRAALRASGHELAKEILVEENGLVYELLLTSCPNSNSENTGPIREVGEQIWVTSNQEDYDTANLYLSQKRSHYQRKARSGNPEDQSILNAYKTIEVRLRDTNVT